MVFRLQAPLTTNHMSINLIPLEIIIGVAASLIAAFLLWAFRKRVGQAISETELSAGQILGWLMAFIILAVIIVGMFVEVDPPTPLVGILGFLVGILMVSSMRNRR